MFDGCRIKGHSWPVGVLIGCAMGCSRVAQSPPQFADETVGPLANVILLPLATRSTDDLLGHAWSAETDLADSLRKVFFGPTVVSSTDQRVSFFREVALNGELEADLALVNVSATASKVTHLLYEVRVTSMASLASGSQRYNPESGCCLQGKPTEDCEVGYVYRLLRGTGTIKMMHRLSGAVSASATDLMVARGGARYRVVDESQFTDAYFGVELAPVESVCRTLMPEQEMTPLQMKASPNCVIHRYSISGERESLSRHLPDDPLCRAVAHHFCSESPALLSCRMRFGETEETDLAAPPVASSGEPQVAKPPPVEHRNKRK